MDRKILVQKLHTINELLKDVYQHEKNIGALVGLSGISLFQFYYSKFIENQGTTENDDTTDIAVTILEDVMEKINEAYSNPTFSSGIAGWAWTLDHLEQEEILEIDSDDILPNFDEYLKEIMLSDLEKRNYDFLHGAIGYAMYFLNRFKNTESEELKENYKIILLDFIEKLHSLSEKEGTNKLKWLSTEGSTKLEIYNLALSHGMASIIGILSRLNEYDEFRSSTEVILKKAVNFVLEYRNDNQESYSVFPSYIPKNGEVKYDGRVAWCYGDLGVGLQLWFASKTLKDKELEQIALATFKHTAKRRTPNMTNVCDAGICHGSFGNAQIFHKIYKETNDIDFKNASDFWLEDGLNSATHDDGYAGYKQWRAVRKSWTKETSVLEGIAGIGLVIITKLADFDTSWDECLLIS